MQYDTSAQQFGGSHFGGGAGFMPASPAAGRPTPMQTTPASTTRGRPNYEEQCLLPLSIKQIITASPPSQDQNLRIDGKEVYHVTLVGWVEEIDVQTTHTTFRLADGSGMIQCKMWNSEADQQRAEKISQIRVKHWVRVIGRIQNFQGVFSVTGFHIMPITNFNDVTFHTIEVIHAHLVNTSIPAQPSFMDTDVQMAGQMNDMSMRMPGAGGSLDVGEQSYGQNDDLGRVHRMILDMMRSPQFMNVDEGVHVDVIFQQFAHVDRNEIRQVMEELSNEGLVYTTIDDEHFKTTEN